MEIHKNHEYKMYTDNSLYNEETSLKDNVNDSQSLILQFTFSYPLPTHGIHSRHQIRLNIPVCN